MSPSARRRSRWFVAAVGLFSLVLIAAGGGGIALLWAGYSYRSLGEPAPETAVRTIALDGPLARPPAGLDTASLSRREFPGGVGPAVRLQIDLREGRFEILPGPPGSDITVDGSFASNYYDLLETREARGRDQEVVIRLRPRAGWLTRIMAGLTHIDRRHPNQLRVLIPPDLPVDLDLRLDSGDSRVELGGLLLTGLDVSLTKGSFRLAVDEPLAAELPRAALHLGMGDGRISRLGNIRAEQVQLETGMGGFRVDLGGAWRPAAASAIEVSHKMGDLTLTVPRSVRLDPDSSSMAIMGGIDGSLDPDDFAPADDAEAPILRLETTTSMGGVHLRRR